MRATETQMRRALGLDAGPSSAPKPVAPANVPDGAAQRRRFVRNGDVPVTIVHRSHLPDEAAGANRLDAARQALQVQTAAREEAARLLAEAQTMNRDLQTKLAHERMAHEEATRHAEARLREVEEALLAEQEQRRLAEAERDEVLARFARLRPPAPASEPAPRPRGRPPKPRLEPDQPDSPYVEWWVPGWKDKFR